VSLLAVNHRSAGASPDGGGTEQIRHDSILVFSLKAIHFAQPRA
jgi:hypothetical protein